MPSCAAFSKTWPQARAKCDCPDPDGLVPADDLAVWGHQDKDRARKNSESADRAHSETKKPHGLIIKFTCAESTSQPFACEGVGFNEQI